jgi:hypothetical protein
MFDLIAFGFAGLYAIALLMVILIAYRDQPSWGMLLLIWHAAAGVVLWRSQDSWMAPLLLSGAVIFFLAAVIRQWSKTRWWFVAAVVGAAGFLGFGWQIARPYLPLQQVMILTPPPPLPEEIYEAPTLTGIAVLKPATPVADPTPAPALPRGPIYRRISFDEAAAHVGEELRVQLVGGLVRGGEMVSSEGDQLVLRENLAAGSSVEFRMARDDIQRVELRLEPAVAQ